MENCKHSGKKLLYNSLFQAFQSAVSREKKNEDTYIINSSSSPLSPRHQGEAMNPDNITQPNGHPDQFHTPAVKPFEPPPLMCQKTEMYHLLSQKMEMRLKLLRCSQIPNCGKTNLTRMNLNGLQNFQGMQFQLW